MKEFQSQFIDEAIRALKIFAHAIGYGITHEGLEREARKHAGIMQQDFILRRRKIKSLR